MLRLSHATLTLVWALALIASTVHTARPSWWSCVRDIGMYFEPTSDTDHGWRLNPCGYSLLSVEDVRLGVYFASNNRTVAFAGDSTALRAYVYSVNTYLPPLNIPVIRKVATVPRVMTHKALGHYGDEDRSTYATFYNMRYVSTSQREIEEGILLSDGGVMVITLGNWDLNWKLQRNSPMPHLRGGVHNFEAAKAYWTEHVSNMMHNIARCLAAKALDKRPLIVFREQFLPNCEASRFTSKKARYRRCAPLIRPIVVPLYRRVLAPLAWSMNIPVIPMDHVFRDHYKYCAMGDGIHLDFNCMMTEQQHIWNVVLLLVRHSVRQGLGTVNDELRAIPDARKFLNATYYEEWKKRMDMAERDENVKIMHHINLLDDIVSAESRHHAAVDVEGTRPARVEGDKVLATVASDRKTPSPASDAKAELTVVRADRSDHGSRESQTTSLGKAITWERWRGWVLGTVALIAITVYLTRATQGRGE